MLKILFRVISIPFFVVAFGYFINTCVGAGDSGAPYFIITPLPVLISGGLMWLSVLIGMWLWKLQERFEKKKEE